MEPRKRALDNSNDFKLEELRNRRKLVPAVRDFPPGCGINEAPSKILTKIHSNIGRNESSFVSRPVGKVKFLDPTCTKSGSGQQPKVTTTIGTQRKNFENVGSNVSKMTSNGEDKLMNPKPDENSKLKSFGSKELGRNKAYFASRSAPKELGRSKPYFASRSTGKVKYWDPNCESQKSEQKSEVAIVSQKEQIRREKIKEAMSIFEQVYEPLYQENRLRPNGEKIPASNVPLEAAKIVKKKLKWMDPEKILGPVCGVQIGDKFKYRSQLMMIGLHCQHQSGIDYAKIEGNNLAISVVDAHRYSNDSGSSDTLTYSGQGGLKLFGCKLPPEDQKLERGNLALTNSMHKKTPVRVIRKVEGHGKDVFVYDGLYTVDHYTDKKSAQGKIVFKFYLKRVPGQPSLQKMLKW